MGMRYVEVRRHALTKKGEQRGRGSHLSQAGVELARRIGGQLGPMSFVAASPAPRSVETALAMGYAVDEVWDMDGGLLDAAYAELPFHAHWDLPEPWQRYAELVTAGGPLAALAHRQVDLWRRAAHRVAEGDCALVISHGGLIEPGLVATLPECDRTGWGPPFRHGEGARLAFCDGRFTAIEIRRP
jgi:broad specificity phosphatase PhoE